ncbi:MAG: ABC transporter substrate-binding protein [Clostridiales bacterium]|nr:ABC transporter substrate-binding protein [Clostridiales bacterium]
MKRLSLILAAMLLLLTGCGGQKTGPGEIAAPGVSASLPLEETASPVPEAVSFTDDLGREVSVAPPTRVAALIGSFADIWCLAGGRDTLVAAANDTWTSFDLDLGSDVADLGAVKEPNLEVLLAARPDLVIGSVSTEADLELEPTLAQAGIPVAYFDVDGFDDYLRMLEICARLTGCPENYTLYGEKVAAQVEAAIARQGGEPPRVLCMRATGSSCKVKGSEGTVLGEMLAALGCVNVADSDASLLEELSLEAIIAADPDYIFVALQGSDPAKAMATLEATLLSNPAWESLTAVREGRFHTMEQALYNLKPNARWGEAYEKLADILYPQGQ